MLFLYILGYFSIYWVVSVCNYELTYYMKGMTMMNEKECYEAVRHLQFQSKADTVKEKVATKSHAIIDRSRGIITEWEEKSRDFIGNFMDMFNRDGLVRKTQPQ